mmetsp:Transcript_63490/g.138283  ORF Transcript_63490/g.138283 Transcript_63490/m.138283 type:complete len:238 (-) Transcript_63490:111-824(-)
MVVPIGGPLDMPQESMEAPRVVRDRYGLFWWAISLIFMATCIGRIGAMDIFGGINTGVMAFLAWYLVKNDCQQMSQCCVLYFGVMCSINGIFELLPLLASLGGRITEKEESVPGEANQRVYTVTIETHPFYDPSQGTFYNYQSAMMIVAPIVMILGAILAHMTYSCYPTFLFDAEDDGGAPLGGGPAMGGYPRGGNAYGGSGYGGYGGTPQQGRPAAGRPAASVAVFEGRGQRLGDV